MSPIIRPARATDQPPTNTTKDRRNLASQAAKRQAPAAATKAAAAAVAAAAAAVAAATTAGRAEPARLAALLRSAKPYSIAESWHGWLLCSMPAAKCAAG